MTNDDRLVDGIEARLETFGLWHETRRDGVTAQDLRDLIRELRDDRADRDQSRKAQMLLAEVANEEAVKSSYTIDKLRAELADARAEIERLNAVDFVHQGCTELRRKDNEYLIGERDSLRAENERLTIRVETQEQLYDALHDERAELWPKAQVLPEVERQLAAERTKVAKIRDWATASYGGAKTPAAVWPGLAALLGLAGGEQGE